MGKQGQALKSQPAETRWEATAGFITTAQAFQSHSERYPPTIHWLFLLKFKGCHCQNSPSPPPRSHQDPSRLFHWLHWVNTSTGRGGVEQGEGRSQALLVPGTKLWGWAHVFRILSPHSDLLSFLTCWFEWRLHSPHDFSPDWCLTSNALIQDPVLHSFLVPQL